MLSTRLTLSVLVCTFLGSLAFAADEYPWQQKPEQKAPERPKEEKTLDKIPECETSLGNSDYRMIAKAMSELVNDQKVQQELKKVGLVMTNVSWQDTGRYHGSSGGNNISDVRLVAITKDREGKIEPIVQPIVRLPNFEDKTVDVDMSKIFIPVGNAWGIKPFAVSLQDYLESLPLFLSNFEKIKGNLYDAKRDSQVLVSAQATIMPVPKDGEAHFVPSIFNYQSTEEHPAVLVILVSNRGTSVTVIDNSRDSVNGEGSGLWGGDGQMLFHNKAGEKAPFVAASEKEVAQTEDGKKRIEDLKKSGQAIAGQSGVNQVMMIQVPLKHPPGYRGGGPVFALEAMSMDAGPKKMSAKGGTRGLDRAVVDVANYTLGKFVELNGKGAHLERDTDIPIRVDVVRYMVSDTTDLTAEELRMLPDELAGIYSAGSNLGSLVTGDNYRRITRNYTPWTYKWWPIVVLPYIPQKYQDSPQRFLEEQFGPGWIYRFASKELAVKTMATMFGESKAK